MGIRKKPHKVKSFIDLCECFPKAKKAKGRALYKLLAFQEAIDKVGIFPVDDFLASKMFPDIFQTPKDADNFFTRTFGCSTAELADQIKHLQRVKKYRETIDKYYTSLKDENFAAQDGKDVFIVSAQRPIIIDIMSMLHHERQCERQSRKRTISEPVSENENEPKVAQAFNEAAQTVDADNEPEPISESVNENEAVQAPVIGIRDILLGIFPKAEQAKGRARHKLNQFLKEIDGFNFLVFDAALISEFMPDIFPTPRSVDEFFINVLGISIAEVTACFEPDKEIEYNENEDVPLHEKILKNGRFFDEKSIETMFGVSQRRLTLKIMVWHDLNLKKPPSKNTPLEKIDEMMSLLYWERFLKNEYFF